MKTLLLAGAAACAVLSGSSAFAADLPRRVAPAYMAPTLAPIFTWTGFYAGVNGGYGFGDFYGNGPSQAGSPNGGLIGGTLGYNRQVGQIVFGLEADADFAGIGNTQTNTSALTSKGRQTFADTARGRVGFAMNRMLFFATGGYAGGTVRSSVYDTGNSYFNSNSNYLNGYALGAGVEYAIMPSLSAKVEYLYTDLSPAVNFAGSPDATRVGLTTSNIRAGVNYHF